MESTAEEVEQNRLAMFGRMDREEQEAIAAGRACSVCRSPNKGARWFYHKYEAKELSRCENYDFHTKPKARKAQMSRHDWYTVLILLMFANAALFDGQRGWGMGLTGIALLIVVLVDGFGVKL